ncbi:MAG: LTA synthase family protein [Synergistaceae bacterium]|jgi:phosphoglycerol transferase MdoB-like AlkP superfamily enzyme|nr:LTA synthase family protein [Synergistaceae bacterium]
MSGRNFFSHLPTYAEARGEGAIFSIENAMAAAMLAVIWFKFNNFDAGLSPWHSLTFITFAGGVGALLIAMTPPLLFPRRIRGASLILFDVVMSLLLLADILHLRFYADLFSLRNLGLSSQIWEIASSVAALLKPRDLLYFADIPIFALVARFITKKRGWVLSSYLRTAFICTIAMAGVCGLSWEISDYDRTVSGALSSLWDRPAVAIGAGTLVYHAADAWNIIDDAISRTRFNTADGLVLEEWLLSRGGDSEPKGIFGVSHGKNLIMIQVESLQSFVVGMKVGKISVTPNLNRLISESVYFPVVYNQTASGNSSDSELMANASLYPTAKGAAFMRFARNSYVSLGSELASMGYKTVAFHGDRPGFWNRNHMYPSLGFERYVSKIDFAPAESMGLGMSDRSFFEQSLGYLRLMRDEGRPFFAFLVTLSSHYPFNFKKLLEQSAELPLGDFEGTLPGDYIRSITYVDAQLGIFLDSLKDENLLDESVIVLYGDHPAIPRGDHGILSELLGRNLSSQAAWRLTQSIPLIIRLPHGKFAGRRDVPAGQVDIAPSVASLMGVSMPTALGKNLMDPALNRDKKLVVFRNGSYIVGDTWVEPAEVRAFDLRTSDPVEYTDDMSLLAAEAKRQLMLSDMMLEGDMARNPVHSKLRAQNQ